MTVRPEFQVHLLNAVGKATATELAEAYSALLDVIDRVCPPGRERSIAITDLQNSCFWAKRAIAVVLMNTLDPVT